MFLELLAPDYRTFVRERFARKMLGSEVSTNAEIDVIDRAGRRRGISISTVALTRDHRAVGVFAVVGSETGAPHRTPVPGVDLTPRQAEARRRRLTHADYVQPAPVRARCGHDGADRRRRRKL